MNPLSEICAERHKMPYCASSTLGFLDTASSAIPKREDQTAEAKSTIHNRAFRLNNLHRQRFPAAPHKLRPNRRPSSRPRLKRIIRQETGCNLRRRSRRTLNGAGQPCSGALHVSVLVPLRRVNRRFSLALQNKRNPRWRKPQPTHPRYGACHNAHRVNQLFGVRSFPPVRSSGKGVFKRRLIHPEKHNA